MLTKRSAASGDENGSELEINEQWPIEVYCFRLTLFANSTLLLTNKLFIGCLSHKFTHRHSNLLFFRTEALRWRSGLL